MDVDLRKIRYFVAVAENLHFRKAADELHITQPALSRSIGALERELGTQLFLRDKRSVVLTPAGRQLLDDARPLLAAAAATRRRAQRAARGTHHLVVGFRAGIVVTPAVRAFAASDPRPPSRSSAGVGRTGGLPPRRTRRRRLCPPADTRTRAAARPALRRTPARRATGRSSALPANEPLDRGPGGRTPPALPANRTDAWRVGPQRPLRSVEESSNTWQRATASSSSPCQPRSTTAGGTSYMSRSSTQSSTRSTSPEATRRCKLISDFGEVAQRVLASSADRPGPTPSVRRLA